MEVSGPKNSSSESDSSCATLRISFHTFEFKQCPRKVDCSDLAEELLFFSECIQFEFVAGNIIGQVNAGEIN